MSFYSELADTASELLEEFGQSMTLTTFFSGTYDTSTASSSQTPVVRPVTGAAFPFAARDIDQSLVQSGDIKVLVSTEGVDFVPTTSQKLTIGGQVYSIISVQPISPAGEVVVYVLQVRR